MNSIADITQIGRVNSSRISGGSDVFEPSASQNHDVESKQQAALIEWINSILPNVNLPVKASSEELRACLIDGTILVQILNRLRPGSVKEGSGSDSSTASNSENVKKFLIVMDELGIPKFEMSDIEKGSMKIVVDCLLALRSHFFQIGDHFCATNTLSRHGSPRSDGTVEEKRRLSFNSRSPSFSDPSAALMHHVGHKFHEVFQLKQGRYADLSAAKISEMMKSNSLDNAPTQSLLSVVNGILDESIERKNAEIPHRVACLLRKVVQEIERRISTQAEHLRTQNNLFKAREEKYQSRIRVLEALASGTNEENGVAMDQLQQIKRQQMEKSKMEEKKKLEEEKSSVEVLALVQEKEKSNLQLSALMEEKEKSSLQLSALREEKEKSSLQLSALMEEKEKSSLQLSALMQEKEKSSFQLSALMQEKEKSSLQLSALMQEKEKSDQELSALKQELETAKKLHEQRYFQIETEAKGAKEGLQGRLKELEQLLEDSRNKVKMLEGKYESTNQSWSMKQQIFKSHIEFQFGELQELRLLSQYIQHEITKVQEAYSEEFDRLGIQLKTIVDSTENYHLVLAENRRMYNELQDLKGNIRVYCRIRPFLPGQSGKKTTVEHIGEDGELVVVNPAKQGKDAQRMFRFNKVYGPESTQAEVFVDTRPLIRSVLDGYSVCIFAYGQTGSGKTYTMTGPTGATEEEWGVNYRALNDLFSISQNRKGNFEYEIGVQIVEIYNEQVRDLLSSASGSKKLGIISANQSCGLAVPDASMQTVTSTSDVIDLMDAGFKNRAMSATALNERSSRSHSVVSIHVRGKDLQNGTSLQGNLHLVDLAGSERVDRSEVTGDRLKEAQHINKSLSALGDVIFALAQKSNHVPYRNSKLTQVLQSSLGGQAKTLMFVQLNPDASSYSETLSTLKFAERVSGVELGAARSSKEGRDVRELMDQVASLKDTITRKDEEIERLQLLKDLKNVYPSMNGEKHSPNSIRRGHSTTSNDLVGQRSQRPAAGKGSGGHADKATSSDHDNSDHSDRHSEDLDGSADEGSRTSEKSDKSERHKMTSKIRSIQKAVVTTTKDSLKAAGIRKTASNSSIVKPPRRWA